MRFFRFCLVGGSGFLVDAISFWLFLQLNLPVVFARVCAFWLAAITTYFGNRLYTFGEQYFNHGYKQFGSYMALVHVSGLLNISAFWLCSTLLPLHVAFIIGILLGLSVNYLVSALWVFKSQT